MEFEWDDEKNDTNIKKHGVSFEKAKRIFEDDVLTVVDERFHYGELREISIGLIDGILLLTVAHTDTETGIIRLISARKATKQERRRYEKNIR